jgi:hypothetical protein
VRFDGVEDETLLGVLHETTKEDKGKKLISKVSNLLVM